MRTDGGYMPGPLPWILRQKLLDFLKPDSLLCEVSPPDGEFLLSLGHPVERLFAARATGPVEDIRSAERMGDGAFDLLLFRETPLALPEAQRLLKPGGYLIAQQRGSDDGRWLLRRLYPNAPIAAGNCNLETWRPLVQAAGFRILYRNQAYPMGRFIHRAALEDFLARAGLGAPDPQRMASVLRELSERGGVPNQEHVFILIGQKRG